ncbi:MAG: DNA-formamidopyrimidine glycosylase family protein [Planctomycetota bacterium]
MPEGHTIHRAAKDQTPLVAGKKLRVSAHDGRCEEEAALLDGKKLSAIEPLGKHLFYHFAGRDKLTLHCHLGLLGKFRLHKKDPPEPRGATRLRFRAGESVVDFVATLKAEVLDPDGTAEAKSKIGPDPLDPKADVEKVWRRISKSTAPIGGLLMNQQVVSGIGNIYRCEILFRQKVHPRTPGKQLTRDQFDAIWRDSVDLLKLGVRYNRIITVDRDFAKERFGKTYSKLSRRDGFYVYKKTKCPMTGGPVEMFEIANRRVFFSPKWQPMPKGA